MIKEEPHNNSNMQKWFNDNDFSMCSIYNKGKSVVAERFIETLRGKIYEK